MVPQDGATRHQHFYLAPDEQLKPGAQSLNKQTFGPAGDEQHDRSSYVKVCRQRTVHLQSSSSGRERRGTPGSH